jgi:hypothetical protein
VRCARICQKRRRTYNACRRRGRFSSGGRLPLARATQRCGCKRAMSYERRNDVGPTMNLRAGVTVHNFAADPVSKGVAYLESRFPERTSLRGPEILGDILSD